MNNSANAKRQTRVMIVTAALILSLAAAAILLTVAQNRKGAAGRESDTTASSGIVTQIAPETTGKSHRVEEETETKKPEPQREVTTPAAAETEEIAPVIETLPDFIAPVSGMMTKAHSVDVPVYSLTMEDYRTHSGIDIAASLGEAVRAAAPGTVSEIWEDPMMGTCLKLTHSGGACSVYKNLAPELASDIRVGSAVEVGTILGAIGESALAEIAEGTHLHYELEIDGVNVNPAEYMLIGENDTAYEG